MPRMLAALVLVGCIGWGGLARSQTPPAKDQPQAPAGNAWEPTVKEQAPKKAVAPRAKETEAERSEREQLNARLLETASLVQKSEGELTAIEAGLTALEVEEGQKKGSLEQRREENAKLLSALLRMGRNPPPVMITQREDALAVVRSAMLLGSAIPLLNEKALGLANDLNRLATVMTEQRVKRDQVKRETDRLKDERTRLSGLLAEKQKALKSSQPELAAVGAEVAALSKTTDNPDQLIEQGDKVVASRTGLGAYEKEAKSGAAGETQVVILAPPAGAAVPPANAGRMKPAIPFELTRAKLPLPAQGRRVIGFGDKTQYGGQSKGIVLETRAGAQITSPCDGWIVYSSEFRSYGQLLIINAGDGYHVLLAGLSQVDVQPGQFVLAAEPVGTMSSVPAAGGGQASAPVLYVEFRKDNRPVDPGPWWVKKVQE